MGRVPHELTIIWLAILLDLVVAEPPNAVHPVAWMGQAIAFLSRRAPKTGRWKPFFAGAAIVVGGCALCATIGLFLQHCFRSSVYPLSLLAEAVALKLMLSLRALLSAGSAVQRALENGDLSEARRLVGSHLVSRDTTHLNHSQVAAAAIESLAENASDSIVAPLLFYTIAGLPGALAYRFLNTCDAMLGYRDADREWLGKCPARVDDIANLIPSRLTAALIILASVATGGSALSALKTCFRDARVTASPNAGYPMSAAAGALGVELEKCGHYHLGSAGRSPVAHDIGRAARLVRATTFLAVIVMSLIVIAI